MTTSHVSIALIALIALGLGACSVEPESSGDLADAPELDAEETSAPPNGIKCQVTCDSDDTGCTPGSILISNGTTSNGMCCDATHCYSCMPAGYPYFSCGFAQSNAPPTSPTTPIILAPIGTKTTK